MNSKALKTLPKNLIYFSRTLLKRRRKVAIVISYFRTKQLTR